MMSWHCPAMVSNRAVAFSNAGSQAHWGNHATETETVGDSFFTTAAGADASGGGTDKNNDR